MRRGEISPCSSSSRSPTVSFDSPETLDRRQNLVLSSTQSDGSPKTRTIAIAVKAHERLRQEPFVYAFNHLVEQTNCKVVVISCLSHLQDTMGVDRLIDVETFGGVNKKKLEAAINEQITNLNHFLKAFRERLDQRGVPLDIRITAGPRSTEILVQAARALHLHWVVLDRSFSGDQRKIQAELECNLVLMKRGPTQEPNILKLTAKYLGPVDRIDPISEDMSFVSGEHPSSSPGSRTPISSNAYGTPSTITSNTTLNIQETQTVSSHTSSKVYTCFTCMCFGSKAVNEIIDGPTDKNTVMYGATAPGSQAVYLGKVAIPKTNTEVALLSTRITSPEAIPTFTLFKLESTSKTKKSTTKTARILEQELEAQMARLPAEEDEHFNVQL